MPKKIKVQDASRVLMPERAVMPENMINYFVESFEKAYFSDDIMKFLMKMNITTKFMNPAVEFTKDAKAGKFDGMSDEQYQERLSCVERQSRLWENQPDLAGSEIVSRYMKAFAELRHCVQMYENMRNYLDGRPEEIR